MSHYPFDGIEACGFRAVGCNRGRRTVERIPARPHAGITSLTELPALLPGYECAV